MDDLTLSNPLARLERLGTGWLGAVFDWEGVLVEDKGEAHQKAWLVLAEEESKRLPMKWELARADGMKAEQVISEVFCWARDPAEVRRLAVRKHRLVDALALAHERDTEPDLAAIAEDVPAAECERPVVRERPGVRHAVHRSVVLVLHRHGSRGGAEHAAGHDDLCAVLGVRPEQRAPRRGDDRRHLPVERSGCAGERRRVVHPAR